MSTRHTTTCDQCGTEQDGAVQAGGWHCIGLNDFTTGKQRQIDLCPACWASARVAELTP